MLILEKRIKSKFIKKKKEFKSIAAIKKKKKKKKGVDELDRELMC